MERQKSILGRKKKGQPSAPGDFIALGSKTKGLEDLKRPTSPTGLGKRKESPTTSGGPSLAKKTKLGTSPFLSSNRLVGESSTGAPGTDDVALTVEPVELLSSILASEDEMNDTRTEALICGAVKLLRSNRAKPDPVVYLTLMHLSKIRPALFCTDLVTEAFCGLLKRELALTFKAKGNPLVSVLACNILMTAYADEQNWPDSFIKVFVEDSLGERIWVDRDDCHIFVDNIITAFGSKKPPKHLMMTNIDPLRGESPSSPVAAKIGEDEDEGEDADKVTSVFPRYQYQQSAIETYILETIRDILNRRQPMDSSSRNLIRLMAATSGYGEVRSMAAQRMDMWLQNPKLTRVSQDLLLSVCTNCDKHDKQDLEVMAHLTKMRMKTKQLINHFLTCMRELLSQHPENLRMILNHTVYNELSTSRNPNNMPLTGAAFSHSPDLASKILAEIFQDLLTNKEDYLRALRMLLREIVRVTRLDINFSAFCLGLMHERTEPKFLEMDQTLKERYVVSIADLVSMNVLLSVGHNVREAAAGLIQGDKKNLELIHVFKKQVAVIQRDSVWWLHIVIPKILDLKGEMYLHCLKKVLFLESPEHYYNKDNWPPESERGMMLRLASDAPVLEDTLMRLLVIGLLRELPLSALDAITVVDQLVCRAAQLQDLGLREVLTMERLEFMDALLNLCVYKHPENIILPPDYSPPGLAITGMMWKAWLILLVITAYNPGVFGETAWQKYPALQIFMEMAMTNNYSFPPPTTATDEKKVEEFRVQERQIRQQEIQLIIEFETHLAAATSKVTITESTSHLIGQLNHNNPSGPARFPPSETIEQLKTLNSTLKLGQMLCRSRNPDFLLQIINRQGTSQSMPWLAELVESSEGSLDVLPVQCLCEFLLHEPMDAGMDPEEDDPVSGAEKMKMKQQKIKKHHQLLSRLQELVRSPSAESKTMKEVLDYFLQRLSSIQASTRDQAIKGLSLVVGPTQLSPDEEPMEIEASLDDSNDWLLVHLPSLPLFHEVKDSLCIALRKACQVETESSRIHCYVRFLSENVQTESQDTTWNEMALDLAQMLIERSSLMHHVLPRVTSSGRKMSPEQQHCLTSFIKMFLSYMKIARTEDKDTFSWSNSQDQILVKWDSGQSATVHILVVHAMVILFTYGKPKDEENDQDNKDYQELLDMWIQTDGHMPSAFLLDTSEEALLLPDWLKLRMLRSEETRLVNAALLEVEPQQLVLFVQSFGIPVSNMTRLLTALDQALDDDSGCISTSMLDKQYLTALLDIQHQRGAKGGQNFYNLLKEGEDEPKEEDEIKTEEETTTQELWNVEGSGEILLPNSVDKISRLLDQILSDKRGVDKGPAKLFQCFLQAVSTDKVKAAAVIRSFDNLLSSSKREAFAEKVYAATFRSCPILKILHARQPDLHPELLSMMEKLQSLGQNRKSMLTSLLTQVLTAISTTKHSRQPSVSKQMDQLLSKTAGKGEAGPKDFIEGLLQLKDPVKLEKAIDHTMEHFLHKDQRDDGTLIACQALSQDDGTPMSQTCAKLFVDWLSLLDPEIVQTSPELQQNLVFARRAIQTNRNEDDSEEVKIGASVSSQAHLLALLTHQTSWTTLNRCLSQLLQKSRVQELDPVAALDFVWACAHVPKVWQGREKKMHELSIAEDVLGLTVPQISCVIDLIIEEAILLAGRGSCDTSSGNQTQSKPCHRISLLLLCLCDDMQRVIGAVKHLHEIYGASSGPKRENIVSLAVQLYLHFPYIQSWIPESSALSAHMMGSSQLQSQIDVISHGMISSLGQIKTRSQSDKGTMYDANIACRKLAAHHPTIFLRQLPLISSQLSGQTMFSMAEMRHTNRLLLFTHVLGLLELLQPQLFDQEHSGLEDILNSYFSLMQNHGKEAKAIGSMVLKFINILQNFLNVDPERAFPILNKQMELLSNLALTYPDMIELKAFITSLTMPRQSETLSSDKNRTSQDKLFEDAHQSQSGYSSAQLAHFQCRFSKDSSEEILVALQDLDEFSKRKVDVLCHFQSQLQRLMHSSNNQCRSIAFMLVMRSLRFNPRKAENFISSYLDCLESEDPNIVTSALKNLAEFCALCQEDASTILQTAFLVGIKTSLDSSTYIGEALQILNLHAFVAQ